MAYINQEQKKEIIANLYIEFPKKDGWRFSAKIQHSSTIIVQITAGPLDLNTRFSRKYHGNQAVIDKNMLRNSTNEIDLAMSKVYDIINDKNYDNSDAMTDYFNVGFYSYLRIGTINKEYNFKPLETPFTPEEVAEVETELIEQEKEMKEETAEYIASELEELKKLRQEVISLRESNIVLSEEKSILIEDKEDALDSMRVTSTSIFLFNGNEGKLRGVVRIVINNSLQLTGLRIYQGTNGLFLSYPNDPHYKGEEYRQIFYPIDKPFRDHVQTEVLKEYDKLLKEANG